MYFSLQWSTEKAPLNQRCTRNYSLHHSKHLTLQLPAHISVSWIHTHTLTCISLSPYLEGCLLPWLFLRSFFSSAWHFSKLSPLLLCSIWYFFSAAWGGQHKVSRGTALLACIIVHRWYFIQTHIHFKLPWHCIGGGLDNWRRMVLWDCIISTYQCCAHSFQLPSGQNDQLLQVWIDPFSILVFSVHGHRGWSISQHALSKRKGIPWKCWQSITELTLHYVHTRAAHIHKLKETCKSSLNMRSLNGSTADLHLNTSEFLTVMIRMIDWSKSLPNIPSLKWLNVCETHSKTTDQHKWMCLFLGSFYFFCKTTHFHRMSHNSQPRVGSNLCNLLQWFGWKPVGN